MVQLFAACLSHHLQDGSRLAAAAAALAAVANGHQNSDSPDEQHQEEPTEADKTDTDQEEQQQSDDQQQQQHLEQHGIKEGSLAHRLAVELNGLSQGYSQGVGSQGGSHGGAVAGMYDTGDEGDGTGAGDSPGTRPQRLRKPKQYLGEPETTPRAGSTRGSLPNTPGSSTRRKVRYHGLGYSAFGSNSILLTVSLFQQLSSTICRALSRGWGLWLDRRVMQQL